VVSYFPRVDRAVEPHKPIDETDAPKGLTSPGKFRCQHGASGDAGRQRPIGARKGKFPFLMLWTAPANGFAVCQNAVAIEVWLESGVG
jgi:hypothetical protein